MTPKKKQKQAVFGSYEPPQKAVTVRISDRHYKALVRFQRANKEAYLSGAAAYLLERSIDEIEGSPAFPSLLERIEGAQEKLAQVVERIEAAQLQQLVIDQFKALEQLQQKGELPRDASQAALLRHAKKLAQKKLGQLRAPSSDSQTPQPPPSSKGPSSP